MFGAIQTRYFCFFFHILLSVFIRFCEDCIVLAACQQFRVRDSRNITAFIASVSEPIIETSSFILFAPFQLSYPELQGIPVSFLFFGFYLGLDFVWYSPYFNCVISIVSFARTFYPVRTIIMCRLICCFQ